MKNQMTVTLAQIKKYSPLASFWSKVLKANGGRNADLNKRFPVSSILDSNGLEDTLWALRCLPEYNVLWRKFAWWCAEQVKDNARDDRVSRCLEVVKRYCEGLATDEELSEAADAAAEAADAAADAAAHAAADAAADAAAKRAALAAKLAADSAAEAADAADAAAEATWAVARAAAEAAWLARAVRAAEAAAAAAAAAAEAADAADAAAKAAAKAATAAWPPVWLATWSAARSAQEIKLREILDSGTWRD